MVIVGFTGEFVWREPGRQVGRLARVNHAVTKLELCLRVWAEEL